MLLILNRWRRTPLTPALTRRLHTQRIYIQTSYSVNEIIYNIKGPNILQLHKGIYLEKYKCSKSNYIYIYGKMFFKEVLLYLFDQKYSDFVFFVKYYWTL